MLRRRSSRCRARAPRRSSASGELPRGRCRLATSASPWLCAARRSRRSRGRSACRSPRSPWPSWPGWRRRPPPPRGPGTGASFPLDRPARCLGERSGAIEHPLGARRPQARTSPIRCAISWASRSSSTSSATSPRASRRSPSPASARCPTFPRRTTGIAATSSSTSGSPRASAGCDVVDMACGEGYGAASLARARGARSSASSRTPRPTSTRACATRRVALPRDIVETFVEPCDAVVFLQTIEHVPDPGAVLEHFSSQLRPGGVAYVSTPNVLTLAPEGAEKSGQPVARQGVPRRGVPRALRGALRPRRAARPVPRAQAARPRAGAAPRALGRACTPRLRHHQAASTTASRRRSRRATSPCAPTASTARWTSSPSAGHERRRAARDRPAHPHALRRGLRHVAVRRGVAVGGDRRRATCRCSTCSSDGRAGHARR